jgi:tRNA (Thr-GGU) A37 N-methylase
MAATEAEAGTSGAFVEAEASQPLPAYRHQRLRVAEQRGCTARDSFARPNLLGLAAKVATSRQALSAISPAH